MVIASPAIGGTKQSHSTSKNIEIAASLSTIRSPAVAGRRTGAPRNDFIGDYF